MKKKYSYNGLKKHTPKPTLMPIIYLMVVYALLP